MGGGLLVLGFFLFPPFIDLLPNDFLNFGLALGIVALTGLDHNVALFFTYAILPFILFAIGVFVYPVRGSKIDFIFKTGRTLVKKYLNFIKRPRNIIINIIAFILLYYLYIQYFIPML